MSMTRRNIVGWIMLSAPVLVIVGGLVYRDGPIALGVVVLAILLTWMIYKGLSLVSEDW